MQAEDLHQVTVLKGGKPTRIQPGRVSEVVEEAASWRKANAIHRWFVENVQDGNDNCGEYRVSAEQLRALLSLCSQVLEASGLVDGEITNDQKYMNGMWVPILAAGKVIKDASTAKRLLPTQDGFFFGSIDYDEPYLENIKYTKEALEHILAEEARGAYYYNSSW
jgi:hypothetical protein